MRRGGDYKPTFSIRRRGEVLLMQSGYRPSRLGLWGGGVVLSAYRGYFRRFTRVIPLLRGNSHRNFRIITICFPGSAAKRNRATILLLRNLFLCMKTLIKPLQSRQNIARVHYALLKNFALCPVLTDLKMTLSSLKI